MISPYKLFELLSESYEKPLWWPMDSHYHKVNGSDPRFEIIVGAILTQNTAWSNVERALQNLKNSHVLDIYRLSKTPVETLKTLIKPSGFFNQKADRLQITTQFLLQKYQGDLDCFFSEPLIYLRKQLLSLNGIGPETADSILLYAGNKPVFVVDAYTKRLCQRIPLAVNDLTYDTIQHYFQQDLASHYSEEQLVTIYNEFHALIVIHAKHCCTKRKPQCKTCPIEQHCHYPTGEKSQ
jgi:endonuclease-3 related protein